MNYVTLICARGGSKGVPGKNIRPLGGKPLIAWAVEHARAIDRISRVIVSTDSAEIAEIARNYGAETPFLRPAELANDNSPEWLVWRHALEFLKASDAAYPDTLVVVPATAPLRLPEDLSRCLDRFEEGDADVVITVSEAHRSPYFNMVKLNDEGLCELVIPPQGLISRRQDVPSVYDITTVAYVVRTEFVQSHDGLFQGRVAQVVVPIERAIDIDTPLDFEIAEFLLQKRNSA